MKIICIENCFTDKPISMEFRPDSSHLRENDPFYLKCGESYSFHAGIALRISRITKCINPKFASRNFDQIRLAIAFKNETLFNELESKGISTMPATCFDYSLALSEDSVESVDFNNLDVNLEYDSKEDTLKFSSSLYSIEKIISTVSESLTLKVGDYVVVLFPNHYEAKVGRVKFSIMDKTLLDFEIK
ncbi:MAG: hypothetical protein KBS95_02020 [Alistipes sp.]|nr:hypothetical protein [Candidatus Alistipes equi]